ncbi:MAG: FG-GAP repeat protein [Anaerolineae bacterium]|nr:FG-GAP repeat protein [Anaerolineae bacterium]
MKSRRVWLVLLVVGFVLMPDVVIAEGGPPGLTGGFLESSTASVQGEFFDQAVGQSIAIAGDVNGDGFDDVLVGAPGNLESTEYKGQVWLFLGGKEQWHLDLDSVWADVVFYGETFGDWAGFSVAGAGDVNDDGYDDIVIGAPQSNDDDGKVYLVLGGSDLPEIHDFDLSTAAAIFTGNGGELAGWSVSSAGDMNGDGFDDVLIGAPNDMFGLGRAYLVLGSVTPESFSLNAADAIYEARLAGDRAGNSVAGVGDTNGDGLDDLLIGAPDAASQNGEAYLVLGNYGPFSYTLSLSNADRIYSGLTGQLLGTAVTGAGDVNGDGFADLLVSFVRDFGGAYLILGASTPKANCTLDFCTDEGYRGSTSSNTGGRIAGVGDVNADGYADILIGACNYDEGDGTGRASLVLGHSNPSSVKTLSDDADAHYVGMVAAEQACVTQAGSGDVNGDGLSDMGIGSPGWNGKTGRAYLVFADTTSAVAARYRAINLEGRGQDKAIGQSDVAVANYSGASTAPGSVYVTRHFRHTCSTQFATNGLLWTVERHHGGDPTLALIFEYNDWQIVDWPEFELRLWYRERPCQAWIEDVGAELNMDVNRIMGSPSAFSYREYTIAPAQPSPTMSGTTTFAANSSSRLPGWMIVGAVVLSGASLVIEWQRKRHRQA